MINAKIEQAKIVSGIRDWFENNGKDCNAIIGISGGKDSSIVAALCVEALGKDRVIGCLLPDISMYDSGKSFIDNVLKHQWNPAERKEVDCNQMTSFCDKSMSVVTGLNLCKYLGIKHYCRSIRGIIEEFKNLVPFELSEQAKINLPARIRMCILYATAQSHNGRVINTGNLSEKYVGYCTRYGDSAGDFAPIADYTMSEVKMIGYACGLPAEFIEQIPSDGLSGKSDEENLGIKYEDLDRYIRTGNMDNEEIKALINLKHDLNSFKFKPIPFIESSLPIYE